MVEDELEKPSVAVACVGDGRVHVLVGLEDDRAEGVPLPEIFLRVEVLRRRIPDEAVLLLGGRRDVPERIEPGSVLLYPPLAVENVLSDAFQHSVEGQGVVVGYPAVVPADRSQIVEVRTALKFLPDHGHRESLVVDDEASFYAVVPDEFTVGRGIYAVSGEHLRAERLHLLDVVGVDDGYVLASLHPCLVGELRKVVDGARVLLERPVDRDVVVLNDRGHAQRIEILPLASVLSDALQQGA